LFRGSSKGRGSAQWKRLLLVLATVVSMFQDFFSLEICGLLSTLICPISEGAKLKLWLILETCSFLFLFFNKWKNHCITKKEGGRTKIAKPKG